ncbi:phage tail tape measure protein [Microvirga sp. VF16]|uniref:phage tail tape measure protein n=1 Tax=Microvirga sp. VF16 TaxID=2807101 RepID=UPI00193E2ED1|nr:phage tail tape measure protein [Microvirga sp. VF16]QRM28149.1 phage tail tape measure protein [Microvirga sp. VF16]
MPDNPFKQKLDEIRDDKKQAARQLDTLIGLSDRFGESLSNAFAKNVSEGKKFDNVLKDLRKSFTEFALKSAMAPLQMALTRGMQTLMAGLFGNALPMGPDLSGAGQSLGGGLSSLLGSLFGAGGPALAKGGVLSRGMVMPFAQGGVIGAPTYFPLGRGLGLMGEQGAEAVMPLARGPDGRLGVRSGHGGRPVSVTMNISTPDAESFRRSEAQVSAALARAVARGQRGM